MKGAFMNILQGLYVEQFSDIRVSLTTQKTLVLFYDGSSH